MYCALKEWAIGNAVGGMRKAREGWWLLTYWEETGSMVGVDNRPNSL